MRIVPINCVKNETLLAKTIYNSKGNILLRQGTTLTLSLIEKIKAADIYTIYIDDGYCEKEIHDVIKPEVRAKAVKSIKETFTSIENDIKNTLTVSRNFNKRLKHRVMGKYIEKIKSISDAIIEDIMNSHHLMINIIDIKHLGEYMYEHSINVAILSLVVGIEMRMNKHELYTLFTGAVLHDVGKVFLDPELLTLGDDINEASLLEYQTHTTKGFKYLQDNKGFAAPAKIVILQHHEHVDGSGYPNGTPSKAIHLNARIVAVCNTYDRLTSDSKNSPAVPANEAIEYIMGNAGTRFDFDVVNTFVRKVNPYPVGTLVDLSNRKTGVIIDSNTNYPLRPIVQVLEVVDKKVIRHESIDLLVKTDVTILRIRYKDLLQVEAQDETD